MGRICRTIVVVTCLLPVFFGPASRRSVAGGDPSTPVQAASGGFQPDEILIELRPDRVAAVRARLDLEGRLHGARTGIPSLDALGARHGVDRIDAALQKRVGRAPGSPTGLERFLRLRLGSGEDPFEALESYRGDPAVSSAQLNYLYTPDVVPNDPMVGQQYAHQKAMAYGGWDIETGDPSVVIAVIGVGVELTHSDLASKLIAGWDFAGSDNNPSPVGDGHETAVAGVAAAASANGLGIAGVCWGCSIMPLRVDYTSFHVAQAVDFARANGARVVNMSFGNYDPAKYGPDTMVDLAIQVAFNSGLVLVASSGNDGLQAWPRYPGALDEVIGVGATDQNDRQAGFSNYGGWVDVAAPGDGVISTLLSGFGTYGPCTGTSFSAPYVAGLAGLILSQNPSLAPYDVGIIIKSTADPLTFVHFIGRGRVNVQRALSQNGLPAVFANIDAPWEGKVIQQGGMLAITGTVMGDSFVLESRDYTEGWLTEPGTLPPWVTLATGGPVHRGTLATLNLDAMLPGQYQLRLTARRVSLTSQHTITLVRTSPQLSGWPVNLGSSITAEPTLADLDGDGTLEILAGRSDGWLSILRHDGSSFPGWPAFAVGGIHAAPSVGDIDGDGDLEIVATSQFNSRVTAWHHNGVPVAGFPVSLGASWIISEPVLASFDADIALEIVVVQQNGTVHVFNAPGATELTGWPRSVTAPVPMSPAVGDIDGDGALDIVVRSETALSVLRADGTNAAGWPRAATTARGVPAIADLDGDGSLEILDAALSRVTVWRSDGMAFERNLYGIESDHGVAVGDLTGNGSVEFFYGASNLAHSLNGVSGDLPGWPVLIGHSTTTGMLLADFDGDPEQEAGYSGRDRGVFILSPGGGFSRRPVVVGDPLQDTPAVGDLDGDGHSEMVTGTLDGWLRAFLLPGSGGNANADWPQHQADARHTGHHRFIDHHTDSDGDGQVDRYDCAPGDPSVHGGVVEICNGLDDNCSGLVDDVFDPDGDGVPSCPQMVPDCDDSNPYLWGSPSEVLNFDVIDPQGTMTWSSPVVPGSWLLVYDVIRATAAQSFASAATCTVSDLYALSVQDPDLPAPGQVFHYLVRAKNGCPSPVGYGSLGTDSSGNPRSARYCP